MALGASTEKRVNRRRRRIRKHIYGTYLILCQTLILVYAIPVGLVWYQKREKAELRLGLSRLPALQIFIYHMLGPTPIFILLEKLIKLFLILSLIFHIYYCRSVVTCKPSLLCTI